MSTHPSSRCYLSRIPLSTLSLPSPSTRSRVTPLPVPSSSHPNPDPIPDLIHCSVFFIWLPFPYSESHTPCPVPVFRFLYPLSSSHIPIPGPSPLSLPPYFRSHPGPHAIGSRPPITAHEISRICITTPLNLAPPSAGCSRGWALFLPVRAVPGGKALPVPSWCSQDRSRCSQDPSQYRARRSRFGVTPRAERGCFRVSAPARAGLGAGEEREEEEEQEQEGERRRRSGKKSSGRATRFTQLLVLPGPVASSPLGTRR